ncbi:MAG TPA: tetratricopeptide repeat protein [Bryobacteraceae bacterium]|jgi:tetratricopeptide (TPR) repeat protein|nr:tetratricopeptide repeat protein [Bryobacteraceae bacterium]
MLACCILLTGLLLQAADSYASLCQQAAELSKQHDYQGAIVKYQAALAIRPGAPEASNNLAVMLYQVGRFSEALALSSGLWRAHPEVKSAALIAGMAAVQCNRPREAIEPLESLLAADPSNRDALLALASAYFGLKDLPKAAAVYERELQAYPNDVKAWYGAAICYESLAEDASRALAKMPGGVQYSKRLLADYLQSIGDPKMAAEAFGESSETSVESPEAARQYERAREVAEKSRRAFEQMVNLSPGSWQAELFLGDAARQRGDFNAAIAHYEAAAKQQPENPAPQLGLGTAYWELGDFEKATVYLQRTLHLKPGSRQAVFELANIDVRQHRDAQAIPLLQKYLVSQPDALAAHADLGRAYFHLKQFADAAPELAKAAEIDTTGDIHYQLSVSLRNLGRAKEADEALRKSVSIREQQLKRSQRLHEGR